MGHRLPAEPDEVWANNVTIGRNWPIFGGERGEYELLAGNSARRADAAGEHAPPRRTTGDMLPEQVWAPDFPPAGRPGFPLGEGTFSATPLAWSHAQYVRLAWSIEAGHPVERPEHRRRALRRLSYSPPWSPPSPSMTTSL